VGLAGAARTERRSRLVVLVGIWGAATVAALVVARITKAGPTLVNVSARHGLHAGDAIAVGVALLVAGLATAWLLRRGRPWGRS
jgi:hypothetical protein